MKPDFAKPETDSSLHAYFLRLADYGSGLLNRLPLELEPQPLNYALGKLSPHLQSLKAEEVAKVLALSKPSLAATSGQEVGVGLNSVGMLADRLTILIIKEWCLRNKGARDEAKAQLLFDGQTLDIIEAMCRAKPGSSAMNSKITPKTADAAATSWPEAFYGLLSTNLLLWESQEVLYIQDIGTLPCEELRAYIQWFSFGNLRRNEYIQKCEELYWNQ